MGTPKPNLPDCATFHSDEQWRALPLVRSMGTRDLVPMVMTSWSGRVIEVRVCPVCGRTIARVAPPGTSVSRAGSMPAPRTSLESC